MMPALKRFRHEPLLGSFIKARVFEADAESVEGALAPAFGEAADKRRVEPPAYIAADGHIGAQARFEYTVIGDPVNEAARLTELAKLEEGHVLASAIAVSGARDGEALCWDVGENVELPGRTESTQVARPVKLIVPSEV